MMNALVQNLAFNNMSLNLQRSLNMYPDQKGKIKSFD